MQDRDDNANIPVSDSQEESLREGPSNIPGTSHAFLEQTKKRKRQKLRCLECQKIFDDDYRTQHNAKYHAQLVEQGIHIRFETADAVLNPFHAAARKSREVFSRF